MEYFKKLDIYKKLPNDVEESTKTGTLCKI